MLINVEYVNELVKPKTSECLIKGENLSDNDKGLSWVQTVLNLYINVIAAAPPNENKGRSQVVPQGLQLVGNYSDSSEDSS